MTGCCPLLADSTSGWGWGGGGCCLLSADSASGVRACMVTFVTRGERGAIHSRREGGGRREDVDISEGEPSVCGLGTCRYVWYRNL